jgi:hypothetical protein
MQKFTVEKIARGYRVFGVITVAGVIGARSYERCFRLKKEAEQDAAAMEVIEDEAMADAIRRAEARLAEVAAKKAYRAAIRAERETQMDFFGIAA